MKNTTETSRFLTAVTFAAAAFAATIPGQAAPIEVPNWNFEVPRPGLVLVDGGDAYLVPSEQSWHQYNVYTNGGTAVYWNPGVPGVNDGQRRWADVAFSGNAPEGDHVGLSVTRYNDNKYPDGTTLPSANINPTTGEPYPEAYVRDFEALCQVLEDVPFDPSETYTLTVDVGHLPSNEAEGGSTIGTQEGFPSWNGYRVQLLAGGEESGGGSYRPTVYAENGGTVIAQDDNSVEITVNTFETITVTYTPSDLTPEQEAALAGLPIQIRLCALEDPSDHSTLSIVAFDKVLLDGPATVTEPFVVTIAPAVDPNTGYDLQWTSQTGMTYTVLTSTDLATPVEAWTEVVTDLALSSYNVPADGGRRFYVVKEVPNP